MIFLLRVFVVLATIFTSPGQAATLRTATRVVEPFVFETNGSFTGFSIELWGEICRKIGIKSQLLLKDDVKAMLAAVTHGEADFAISAISITAERENELDFSQPIFDSGLLIMTPVKRHQHEVLTAVLDEIFSSAILPWLGTMVLIILVPAHLVWFAERRHPQGMLGSRHYFPGIFEACWWAASTLATQADQMPRAMLARAVAVVWMFASVIFVAYFTAGVTSSLTLQKLHGDINGPADLAGRRVVTVLGSTSAEFLRARHVTFAEFKSLPSAIAMLETNEADALVYDAPALLYFAAHEGQGKVQIVGSVFKKESYGIAVRENSPLLKAVDSALLKLREDGTYDLLYARWFGGRAGGN